MITEKAVAMPGCAGAFTMVAFNANDVPVGTVVYASKENELLEALEAAKVYVTCAYECAFPDEQQNNLVLQMIEEAIAKAKGEV